MKLKELKLGEKIARLPIIQGGMSIRISTGKLAGAVASTGAVGIIGASGMEHDELADEIKTARKIAKGGIIGINILYAAKDFLGIVNTAIKEKIDFITSGAGFSRDLFKIGKDTKTPILPIVSSGKFARLARSLGATAIVAESKEAGGHLGTLDKDTVTLLKEVKEAVSDVPIIAAGGITDGCGIAKMIRLGADGVQLATNFVLAEECNAAPSYQAVHQAATKPEDVIIIKSPVGLPGRALKTKLTENMEKGMYPDIPYCDDCLKSCSKRYCIFDVLKKSQRGDVDNGIVFSGEKVWKIKNKNIRPAAEIINELVREAEECLSLVVCKKCGAKASA
jgi:NAD(P)H-dependent flavin oxidoreductase YrpB (nitropropane dioxygenase family)